MRPTRAQRQEELRRLERWLQNYYADHPVRFHVLAVGLAFVLFYVPMGMVKLADWIIGVFR
jgi:hypothetical protein